MSDNDKCSVMEPQSDSVMNNELRFQNKMLELDTPYKFRDYIVTMFSEMGHTVSGLTMVYNLARQVGSRTPYADVAVSLNPEFCRIK